MSGNPASTGTSTDTDTDTDTGEATPVGTWSERLSVAGQAYTSTLRFTSNGRAMIVAGPRPGCVGAGEWTATGPGRFSFRLVELVFDTDGAFTGWVDIDQEAVQNGDTFTSTGISHVYDANDVLQAGLRADAESSRVV